VHLGGVDIGKITIHLARDIDKYEQMCYLGSVDFPISERDNNMTKERQELDEALANIHEALDLYDFADLEKDIETLDDVRFAIRDFFIYANQDVPFPWEELAALAVIGTSKKL